MKPSIYLATGLLGFALLATGCEEQEEKAKERGKIPKETVQKAEETVKNAVKALEQGLEKAGEELDK